MPCHFAPLERWQGFSTARGFQYDALAHPFYGNFVSSVFHSYSEQCQLSYRAFVELVVHVFCLFVWLVRHCSYESSQVSAK